MAPILFTAYVMQDGASTNNPDEQGLPVREKISPHTYNELSIPNLVVLQSNNNTHLKTQTNINLCPST
jgi:hypothetical protein